MRACDDALVLTADSDAGKFILCISRRDQRIDCPAYSLRQFRPSTRESKAAAVTKAVAVAVAVADANLNCVSALNQIVSCKSGGDPPRTRTENLMIKSQWLLCSSSNITLHFISK